MSSTTNKLMTVFFKYKLKKENWDFDIESPDALFITVVKSKSVAQTRQMTFSLLISKHFKQTIKYSPISIVHKVNFGAINCIRT